MARDLVDEGTPLQLNDVARRAGLGVGTIYRHFPTAEALLEAVATPCLEALAAHGEKALADDNPGRGLADFLTRTIEAQVTDASLATVTASATDALPRTTELKRTLWPVGGRLLDRARDAGVVRPDLTSDDLVPLMCGVAYAANVHSVSTARIESARRYLTALLEGVCVPAHDGAGKDPGPETRAGQTP
ncbi:TetR/AcrR family transcriptional regulator [Streptomyces sp. NBC_01276]|uniref:TetR/AcrR family transcriptional regulator n=1 Tax=Streptomyces sp. NBC_01276 TaxID=2903808 RepID=UPI00352C2D33